MTDRRLVLHIGLEKTGTTSFQRFCNRHRAALARVGVLYPRFGTRRYANHAAFAASYLAHGPRDHAMVAVVPDHGTALRAVRREIAASSAGTVLISAEHFSSRFDRACAARLAGDFDDLDPLIVVAIRDLHGRFLSAYSTSIESGGELTLADYAAEVLDPGNPYLDIAETLAPWREAFGQDRISIIDYDAHPDIVAALLRACGVAGLDLGQGSARRHMETLGPEGVEILRTCNAMLRIRQGDPAERSYPIWHQHSYFSQVCRRRIQDLGRADAEHRWRLGADALADLNRRADAERRWLRETLGFAKRLTADRSKISAAMPHQEDDGAERRVARGLVRRVTRLRWRFSQAIVAGALAAMRLWGARSPAGPPSSGRRSG